MQLLSHMAVIRRTSKLHVVVRFRINYMASTDIQSNMLHSSLVALLLQLFIQFNYHFLQVLCLALEDPQ